MIGIIRRLSVILLTMLYLQYINFHKHHLDFGVPLYDKPNNENFTNKMGKVQYRAWLAITGEIQGTFR